MTSQRSQPDSIAGGGPATGAQSSQPPTMLGLATVVLRRWRLVVRVSFWGAATMMALSLIMSETYTATTDFVASPGGQGLAGGLANLAGASGLAGLASQAGLLGAGTGPGSPEFYEALLTNQAVLESTLVSRFPDPKAADGSLAPLIDILRIKGEPPGKRIYRGLKYLERKIKTDVDKRTGIVTVSVKMPNPPLAADVTNRLVAIVNKFAVDEMQFQSRAQRVFSGERLAQAQRELYQAEDEQLHFLQLNRSYQNSPVLAFEASRLERRVTIKQEVFLTLTREYEQARVAEVQDTPVLTVIDRASPPYYRSSPSRKVSVVFVGLLLFVLTSAGVVAFEYRARLTGSVGDDYAVFSAALRAAWTDFRRGFRLSRRHAS